uniref:Benzyl alcohol O-benzoyltransferase n=1 Tax=Ananas comosus var. bracteatus TaxID=296719 RepID=A0A6V7NQJ3_ANACO|nr:unnamed protein product [Ananas comosus var. bracteatus]
MADAVGLMQFRDAMFEMAAGAAEPTIPPVWAREMLNARSPPCVTHPHPEYEEVPDPTKDRISRRRSGPPAFFFGEKEMSALHRQAPAYLRGTCSRFDMIAAYVWRCRTIALGYDPEDEVRGRSPVLPHGFYGNAFVFTVASSTAGELCRKPFSYALELVAAAKARSAADDHLQSVADLMVLKGRPRFATARTYLVSDLTKMGLDELDFGWGTVVYAVRDRDVGHIPLTSAERRRGKGDTGAGAASGVCDREIRGGDGEGDIDDGGESHGYGGRQYATRSRAPGAGKADAHELKPLSDIDDQRGLRFYRSGILFCRINPAHSDLDPAAITKRALAEALVYYYPLAGRLRAGPGDKLIVECTGEGAVFVEANADVRLEDFGPALSRRSRVATNYSASLRAPLATSSIGPWSTFRWRPGPLSPAYRPCGPGDTKRPVPAVRHAPAPGVRGGSRPTKDRISPADVLAHQPFFFGEKEMCRHCVAGARLPARDLLSLQHDRRLRLAVPHDRVGLRSRRRSPNTVRSEREGKRNRCSLSDSTVTLSRSRWRRSTAGELCRKPFSYALELVAAAKARSAADDHLQSVADLMVLKGRPRFAMARTYLVSDLTKMGMEDLDFGWGRWYTAARDRDVGDVPHTSVQRRGKGGYWCRCGFRSLRWRGSCGDGEGTSDKGGEEESQVMKVCSHL